MSMLPDKLELGRSDLARFDQAVDREWLVTNGLGGFAAGTVAGACTRRYHGLLIAALTPPVQRTLLVAKLDVRACYDGHGVDLTANEYVDGTVAPQGQVFVESFSLHGTVPVWRYVVGDAVLTQRIFMTRHENTTHVQWHIERSSGPVELALTPLCTHRDYHEHARGGVAPGVRMIPGGVEITAFASAVPYRLLSDKGEFASDPDWHWGFRHRAESARGQDSTEDLYRPGSFLVGLSGGETMTLTLTAEPGPIRTAASALQGCMERAMESVADIPADTPLWVRRLYLAADDFIVTRRNGESTGTTVIAGYPWFADWGRDTMIALTGLTLVTRRFDTAANVLRTFARFVDQGMLPNRFPDAGEAPEYNTVDASLWYFHAIDQYIRHSGDRSILETLYPVLVNMADCHLSGTRYGIGVDTDGLLMAGEPGVQLTWMDARVGEFVVTPRSGKAVEINALWYRALVILAGFASDKGDRAAHRRFETAAQRVASNFEPRFWNSARGYLNDVVDTPEGVADASLRPNQLIAAALAPELLGQDRLRAVVDVCARRLWTPFGLRSLAPDDPSYVGRYAGDPAHRDGCYHQGTVWAWLLGPFSVAHYHAYHDAEHALSYLSGLADHLRSACVGSVSEVFDGDPPHSHEGCFAQAWSVAQVLEAWHEITSESAYEHGLALGAST